MVTCENELVNADSLELSMNLDENSVDLLFTDCPYNISIEESSIDRSSFETEDTPDLELDFGDWDREALMPEDWIPLFMNCLKENSAVVIFYDNRSLDNVIEPLEEYGFNVVQPYYWVKTNPVPSIQGTGWMEGVESAVIATQGDVSEVYQKDEGYHKNYVRCKAPKRGTQTSEERIHPTQKPMEVADPVVKWWTDKDSVVLDPFMGSGTFVASAKKHGRSYIGVEKDEEHYKKAEDRVENTLRQESEDVLDF